VVSSRAGRVRVELSTRDESGLEGRRVLTTRSCALASDSAALLIAMTVDPNLGESEDQAATEEVAPTPQVEAPPLVAAEKPPHDGVGGKIPSERGNFVVAPILAGDVGLLPNAGVGIGASVGFHFRDLRLEVDGARYFSNETYLESGAAGGAFELTTG